MGAYASIKPIEDISIGGELNLLFKGTKVKDRSLYNGVEINTSLNYVLLDDVLFGLDIGLLHQEEQNTKFAVGLKGIISF